MSQQRQRTEHRIIGFCGRVVQLPAVGLFYCSGCEGRQRGIHMQIEWKSCLRLGISVFILFLCIHYWDAFTGVLRLGIGAAAPLLTGCVIAYIINILMSFYEKHYFLKYQNLEF